MNDDCFSGCGVGGFDELLVVADEGGVEGGVEGEVADDWASVKGVVLVEQQHFCYCMGLVLCYKI